MRCELSIISFDFSLSSVVGKDFSLIRLTSFTRFFYADVVCGFASIGIGNVGRVKKMRIRTRERGC